jgi:hypothetical protein
MSMQQSINNAEKPSAIFPVVIDKLYILHKYIKEDANICGTGPSRGDKPVIYVHFLGTRIYKKLPIKSSDS